MQRFREIRVLEWTVLGHGPLWLGFMLDAFLETATRVTILHPDHASYDALDTQIARRPEHERKRIHIERVKSRIYPLGLDQHEALELARAPGADLCVITMADQLIAASPDPGTTLSRHPGTPIVWGFWLFPVDPSPLGEPIWRRLVSTTARARRRQRRNQLHPPAWLDGAFFLDEILAERVALPNHRAVLPDPWPTRPRADRGAARQKLKLPADAPLFLHAGVADARKGLDDALSAFERSRGPGLLVRAGEAGDADRPRLARLVERGRAISEPRRVSDMELDLYLRACDWVLLPYRDHEGSSGLLSGAAAARRPVVVPDYGLLGRRVSEAGLGRTFSHCSAKSLRRTIEAACRTPIEAFAPALDAYANLHSPEGLRQHLRATIAGIEAHGT